MDDLDEMMARVIVVEGEQAAAAAAALEAKGFDVRLGRPHGDDVVIISGGIPWPPLPMRYVRDEPAEQPSDWWVRWGRRYCRRGGRPSSVGAYKGSRFAKRATRRGGNPARQG